MPSYADTVPVTPLSDADWRRLPPHPRLFADTARFSSLKRQSDPVSRQLMALISRDAEKKLTAPEIVYPAIGFLFDSVRTAQGRILTLSLMYRLTGEKRWFERARHELMRLANLPEWRPSHFLDVGEACLAAGIGLDWLWDGLSEPDRSCIAHAIVHNALLPSLSVREGVGSWVDGDFNWNQVCHAGLTVGALAIAEREPVLARRITERATRNVPNAEAVYAPDGSYPEGPSYWSYGTTFHVLLVESLRSVFGTSCRLGTSPGFLKTADFMLQMVGPTGEDYNFSDYHKENLNEPVMLWFARERRQRRLADTELKDLAKRYAEEPAGGVPKSPVSRHLPLELLWWDETLLTAPNEPLPLQWTADGVLPIAVLRSRWDDPKATYVAIKGGTANHSHGHMDAGSFILETDGVRWALDLGTENYSRMREAKLDLWNYGQDSTRWTTFRVGPEGHNILRFNQTRQDVTGKGEIRPLSDTGEAAGCHVWLSSVYRREVKTAERRIRLHRDRSVTIEDEWTTGADAVDVSWQWLTHAKITKTECGLLLRQQGQSLELIVTSPSAITTAIEDVSQPNNIQNSPNPDLSRIVVRLRTAAGLTGNLRVEAVPGTAPARHHSRTTQEIL